MTQTPLSELLRKREVYEIFDGEFQNATWLDAAALLSFDGTIEDLYKDGTVPKDVLDRIVEKLRRRIPRARD